jgi:hypothetical protein
MLPLDDHHISNEHSLRYRYNTRDLIALRPKIAQRMAPATKNAGEFCGVPISAHLELGDRYYMVEWTVEDRDAHEAFNRVTLAVACLRNAERLLEHK